MPQVAVDAFINQLDTFGLDELWRVNDALQERLRPMPQTQKPHKEQRAEKSEQEKLADFHQALLSAGLITRIPVPRDLSKAERPRIAVIGEPVSETIIRERR